MKEKSQPPAGKTRVQRAMRALARGVTLVEILIVLAIIALIAGGVAVVAVPKLEKARIDATKISLKDIRRAAEMFRADNPDVDCPTPLMLKQKKVIDASSDIKDPWGKPYEIICEEDETVVMSYGKDGRKGTDDDLMVPEIERE